MRKIKSDSWFSIEEFGESKKATEEVYSSTSLRATKIRIYPTREQRKTLIEWFKIWHYVDNLTIHYLRMHTEAFPTKLNLRNTIRREVISE